MERFATNSLKYLGQLKQQSKSSLKNGLGSDVIFDNTTPIMAENVIFSYAKARKSQELLNNG